MSTETLSQDEIDALLDGVDKGAIDTGGEPGTSVTVEGDDVVPYDLASRDRPVHGRLPGLQMINERFARFSRVTLFNLLRQSPDIAVRSTEILRFGDYTRSLLVPTSMNIMRVAPLHGSGLFVFDARLVFSLIDRFFGGSNRHTKVAGREFGATELRVIQRLVEGATVDMAEAWSHVFPITLALLGSEVNPALASVVGPSELAVVNRFHVALERGDGEMHFVLPYSMIEPIRRRLESVNHGNRERDGSWEEMLRERTLDASVPISCTLSRRRVLLRDVLAWKVGDVIPIEMPERFPVRANGTTVAWARLGEAHGNLALRIDRRSIRHEGA
jgi:flagellar motor switch protein FliM